MKFEVVVGSCRVGGDGGDMWVWLVVGAGRRTPSFFCGTGSGRCGQRVGGRGAMTRCREKE